MAVVAAKECLNQDCIFIRRGLPVYNISDALLALQHPHAKSEIRHYPF